ncbi:MAG: hypothetical protein JRJ44_01135 [Deltaproteobacteria bacterium]|nr:hypothetical protein [Deltaproteobacteria bacterium]
MVFPQKSYAYLDPGSGSYILQVVIAGFLGAVFTIKLYWKKFKAFFTNRFSKKKSGDKNYD